MKFVIAAAVIALMAIGFLFVKGPAPAIIVAPEHIFDIGPLAVTNTMFTSWCVVLILCTVAFFAGRGVSVVPRGFSGVIEAMVSGFYGIVVGVAGEQNGRKFFWVVATIFFYVLTSNYFGLLPMNNIIGRTEPGLGEKQVVFSEASIAGFDVAYIKIDPVECETTECPSYHAPEGAKAAPATEEPKIEGVSGLLAPYFRSVNTDVNAPLAIAIFSFIFVEYWGLSALGPGYLKKFFNFSGPIQIFVGLLEFVSELSRMVSFTFRLFGNVFAGEVLLLMMSFLVPFVLVDIFYGLELFVGLIQAFVFAMLTLVFAVTAVSHHGDEGHGDEHGEAAAHH